MRPHLDPPLRGEEIEERIRERKGWKVNI